MGRRVGALRRADSAAGPDRGRSARVAVARALIHAAGGDRAGRGGVLRRARGAPPSRRRPLRVGEAQESSGRRHPGSGARPESVARHCAGIRPVGLRPHGHVPDRRADRRRPRAGVPSAPARAARDADHGGAERRWLGSARGWDRMGVRRGRPRGKPRGHHRRGLRGDGARRHPSRCGRFSGFMGPSYPCWGTDPTADRGEG